MTFKEWASETKTRIKKDGIHGLPRSVYELGLGGIRRIEPTLHIGTPVWEEDWDVLLILDACRYDLFTEVLDEYDFLEDDSRYSVGAGSPAWINRTFDEQYRDETSQSVYVTGNMFSHVLVEESWFASLEEVWEYGWDNDLDTVPARAMTDVAIEEYRRRNPERMIVHYVQPHYPFIPAMRAGGHVTPKHADNIWEALRSGEVNRNKVWNQYRENLRYVLDDVQLLLRSIDAETVAISSDHGNALGEFGFYGHGGGVPFPSVRKVPWSETKATNDGEYLPDLERNRPSPDVEEKLRLLGYG